MIMNSVVIVYVLLIFNVLGFAICDCNATRAAVVQKRLRGWCIASTAASSADLQGFLDYGCSEFDCSAILPGGPCYEPNIIQYHASWILDKFYRHGAFCKEGLGYITQINPSREGCLFPSSMPNEDAGTGTGTGTGTPPGNAGTSLRFCFLHYFFVLLPIFILVNMHL